MKALIYILVIANYVISFGSIYGLEETQSLHMRQIDTLQTNNEPFVLNMIDSLRSAECAEPFYGSLRIAQKFILEDIPCIQVYAIKDGRLVTGSYPYVEQYKNFLFNSCDSTIYPFGGGGTRFSKFIQNYLPKLFDSDDSVIKAFIGFYLNIQDPNSEYYIISSKSEVKELWDIFRKKRPLYFRDVPQDNMEKENIEMYSRSSEFTVKSQNDFKEITISTWKHVGGVLETWHFRVSKTVFDVYDHYIVLYHIGPY